MTTILKKGIVHVATALDFASLLQLGAGLGIGLSFFRTGFDRKQKGLRRRFARTAVAYGNPVNQDQRKELRDVTSLRTRFSGRVADGERVVGWFQAAAFLGGLVNMGLLVRVTLSGGSVVETPLAVFYVSSALLYFVALLGALEGWLQWRFGALSRDLRDFEDKKGLPHRP